VSSRLSVLVVGAVLALGALLSACSAGSAPDGVEQINDRIGVYHDDQREATCWMLDAGTTSAGFSCIADSQLK
jgi:hypothetical protein